jgi:polyisoprenoid-binding protein YceI
MSQGKRLTLFALFAAAGVAAMLSGHQTIVGQVRERSKAQPTAKPVRKPGDIDLDKSRLYAHVRKKGVGHEHAVEGKIKAGSLVLSADRKNEQPIGQIEFDMASFAADTDAARKFLEMKGTESKETQEQITETMRGSKVLDVEKFPKAVFTIKSAEMSVGRDGEPLYNLKGDFTLHGKTRPLEISVEAELSGGKVRRLRGDFTILQSNFGITPYKAAGGLVGVADELKIYGDVWITVDESSE